MNDNMHMFWGGPFSQWYASLFEVEGIQYNCTEQYMMAKKAGVFGDEEALLKIMASDDPREQKRIGRTVEDFVVDRWDVVARDIVFRGNMAKFTQSPELFAYIMSTGDQEIVEASPEDTIWGIGLAADHPDAYDKTKWRGMNWLGEVLTSVRDVLRNISDESKILEIWHTGRTQIPEQV